MKELLDYNASGYLFEDEEVVVESGNINLLHDTIKANSVTIYFDLAHTLPIVDFDLTQYDTTIQQYRAIAFTEDFVADHADEVVYVTYTTYGDIVQAEDINPRGFQRATFTAGENIISLKAVALIGGKLYHADSADMNTLNVIGISRQSGNINEEIEVQIADFLEDPSFNFDTTKYIFVGANGGLTQIPPIAGYSGIIAQPITAKKIKVIEFDYIVL